MLLGNSTQLEEELFFLVSPKLFFARVSRDVSQKEQMESRYVQKANMC